MQHIGKYKVIRKLGSGSFGFVYLAQDPKLQLQVAIKVFKIKEASLMSQVTSAIEDPEPVIKQRFINEARALRNLSANPHIIEMYEFDELADGTPYYVMPYISRTLVDEIGKDAFSQGMLDDIPKADYPRRISTTQAISYLQQLSQALCAVHESALVHRDIKPANILITKENQLQLSDFGIAKLPLSEHSETGFGMGSRNYLSPEQQESAKHVQASSDIYSLGVIAYRMFTGQLPVGRFHDAIDFAPDMPQALNDLIILALSQRPSQRPADGAQFLKLLNQAVKAFSKELSKEPKQDVNHNTESELESETNLAADLEISIEANVEANNEAKIKIKGYTEAGTEVWSAQKTSQIKKELKPIENKIIELLKQYGEIKTDDLLLLQTLADIAHIDKSALDELIVHVTQQKLSQGNQDNNDNNDNKLAAFILWMDAVNKQFNAVISSAINPNTTNTNTNNKNILPDAVVNSLITAGLSTTDKTAEQLTTLINAKQQSHKNLNKLEKINTVTQIKDMLVPLFKKIKQRSLPLLSLPLIRLTVSGLIIIGLTLLYSQYQTQQKIILADDSAWSQAQQINTAAGYQGYLENKTHGSHVNQAKKALTKLIQQKNSVQINEKKAQQQLIDTVQHQLIKHGYPISRTGELDQRTKHAIKTFEKNQGLLVTGHVDNLLLKKLKQLLQLKDEKQWLVAQSKHEINAYQEYKVAFPQGQHFMQASQLIKQLRIEKTNKDQQKKQAQETKLRQLIEDTTNDLLDNMITLPAASFTMGCAQHSECKAKEMPQHNVAIKTFNIMSTEVTFAQWDTCLASGACKVKPDDENWGRGNRPVIGISYHDIVNEFIPWLNKVTAKNFVLPSEAQWEYAAKANSRTKYAWGDVPDCLKARYGQFSGLCGDERKTSTVKSFQANIFGLYDMHGNVWEWTQDCWNDNYNAAPKNGSAWQTGDCNAGVIKGGSWLNEAKLLRSTFRAGYNRSTKANVNGFRLVINSTR